MTARTSTSVMLVFLVLAGAGLPACDDEAQDAVDAAIDGHPDDAGLSGDGSDDGDTTPPDAAADAGAPTPDGSDGNPGGAPDAGSSADGSSDTDASGPRDHVVFVTSTVQNAAFGGLEGADTLCNELAAEAALDGSFVAWLSAAETDAGDRLQVEPGARFVRVDGALLAEGVDDLLDGTLGAAITLDERGDSASGDVWTGTLADGRVEPDRHCQGFTHGGGDASGLCGSTGASDSRWTAAALPACSTPLRLYCFEL